MWPYKATRVSYLESGAVAAEHTGRYWSTIDAHAHVQLRSIGSQGHFKLFRQTSKLEHAVPGKPAHGNGVVFTGFRKTRYSHVAVPHCLHLAEKRKMLLRNDRDYSILDSSVAVSESHLKNVSALRNQVKCVVNGLQENEYLCWLANRTPSCEPSNICK